MSKIELIKKFKNKNYITKNGNINPKLSYIISEIDLEILKQYTNFLTNEPSLRERVLCLLNNITSKVLCPVCNTPTKFNGKKQSVYHKFCSIDCINKDNNIKNKIKETNIEKYGVSCTLQHFNVKNKIKETNIEKYGFPNPFQNEKIKNKIKETNIEKYGVEYPIRNNDIKNKIKETNIEKYGVSSPKQKHISKESLNMLNDKEWLYRNHHIEKKSPSDIATELSVSTSSVHVYLKKHLIPVSRLLFSTYEKEISSYISSIEQSLEIKTNTRYILFPYELDILIPSKNIAFEINGNYWHSEIQGKDKNYHLNKTTLCQEKGIRLIHILESEWVLKEDIVKSRIRNLLGYSEKIYARKTKIKQLSTQEQKVFFNETHIQGYVRSSICYGLEYNGEIVAAMSFGKSRFNKNYEYELLRYSNKLYSSVVGGASKIFKHFVNEYNPKSIISYSDKRWNIGNLYKQLGFTYLHSSNPNYFYFNKNNPLVLYPRIKFQKHKLEKLLESFDPNLTEWENMANNGYDRIWDCGNDVFAICF